MSSNLRVFKKGEHLFNEGEKAKSLYLIQSGLISVFLQRPKKNIEVFQISGSQILGEHVLSGAAQNPFSAVALNETKVLEIPVDLIRAQIGQSSQLIQLLFKSMAERQKHTTNEIKSIRMEKDSSPCPPEHIAKVYGVIFHVAKQMGVEKEDRTTVTWSAFKQYSQRVFLENPVRLENACNILVKLKLAEFEMVKNEAEPDSASEYGYFHILDLASVERFFEYYQHYYYKSGNPEFFKVDDKVMGLAGHLLKFTESAQVNRAGVVQVNYQEIMNQLKTAFGNFTPDQFDRLEKKGLFIKRETNSNGGLISFYRQEFEAMLQNWKILREIEKWNERGVVELVEASAKPDQGPLSSCPACSSEISQSQKFCGNCGHKLIEAKAA